MGQIYTNGGKAELLPLTFKANFYGYLGLRRTDLKQKQLDDLSN